MDNEDISSDGDSASVRPELEEAIRMLRKTDAASVEKALGLLHRAIVSFGMKVCGQREDAEDTAQEVLMKSLPYLAKLEDPRALSAWLYIAAKNRCWQERRKFSYRREVALEDLMPRHPELSPLFPVDTGADAETQILSREDQRVLHEAVLRLLPQYRIVLVLHDMEELDTHLVAKILSIEPGTVRIRLHRARLMLRKELEQRLNRSPAIRRPPKSPKKPSAECRRIFADLSDYLDGEFAPASCEQLRRHIEDCPTCVVFIEDLKQAIKRCRSLEVCSGTDAAPALQRLLVDEYRRLVAEHPGKTHDGNVA